VAVEPERETKRGGDETAIKTDVIEKNRHKKKERKKEGTTVDRRQSSKQKRKATTSPPSPEEVSGNHPRGIKFLKEEGGRRKGKKK